MTSQTAKVNFVIFAYCQIVKQVYKKFTVAKAPMEGKHFENCIRFFDAAQENGATLQSLMLACIDHFPPYWCQKVFKRVYPSITILVSEKSRNRGLKNFPKMMEATEPDAIAYFYAMQLKSYGNDIVEGLLRNGFVEGEKIQERVREILAKERAL